jgi:hypothetical protein
MNKKQNVTLVTRNESYTSAILNAVAVTAVFYYATHPYCIETAKKWMAGQLVNVRRNAGIWVTQGVISSLPETQTK